MIKECKAKISYFFYNIIWLLIFIPFLLKLSWRYRHYSQHQSRLLERLSIYQKAPKECIVWVHVASVGEALGCMPLLIELARKYKGNQLLVTTTTPAGEAVVRQYLGEGARHVYLPFDFIFFMSRFLEKIKPKVLLIFETEVWPSMTSSCYKKGIDTVLINARMSEKSMRKYESFSSFSRYVFKRLTFVVAQSSSDAVRLRSLGVANVSVVGNIKSDVMLSEDVVSASKNLRLNWQCPSSKNNNPRKILLAASTHEGEEKIVLNAYRRIKKYDSNVLLVLVPRHSERFDQVERLCIEENFTVARRSGGEAVFVQEDIVLADTMGELLMLFGTSDVVIMGGTFIDHGGHNFLEPAIWGLPMVSGRSHYNFSGIAQALVNVEALTQVDTSEELSEEIIQLLASDGLRIKKGNAAKQYVSEQKGSIKELLSVIEPYLVDA